MRRFIDNITRYALGLTMLALGIFAAIAFATYDPFDPSINVSSNAKVSNAAGILGAYIAVPAIEVFGVAVYLLALVPLIWGITIFRDKQPSYLWARSILLVLSLPIAASVIALLDAYVTPPDSWPAASIGGLVGSSLSTQAVPYLGNAGFAAIGALMALTFVLSAIGISSEDWRGFMRFMGKNIKTAFRFTKRQIINFSYWSADVARQLFKPSDDEGTEEKPLKIKAPKLKKEKKAAERPAPVIKDRRVIGLSSSSKTEERPRQASLNLSSDSDTYVLPPLDLLTPAPKRKNTQSESSLSQNAELLERVLDDFGINGEIVEVQTGPVVTLYVLEPSPGTKSSRVIGLADDIARSMSAVSARIAVIPGRNAIGIELPNSDRETVYLREIFEDKAYEKAKHALPLALGKDIGGQASCVDLAKMPHVLVAGTTGSGKSVGINGMILSLLYKFRPDECKFIMIDPKMLELSVYDGIPHLLCPVVTEPGKAVVALKWAVKEMEQRYRLMSNLNVRNIANYNQKLEEARKKGKTLTQTIQTGFNPETGEPIMEEKELDMNPMPMIVVIVDEMADLMLVAGKDVESSIQRLAQMARAAGIHLIMATQRPSVDVITGVIKANFPTRISYQVTSKIDSRTILGEQGAEQLLGMGDMLHMAGGGKITRVHGAFVEDSEVEDVVKHICSYGEPEYISDVTRDDEQDGEDGMLGGGGERDELYDQAVAIVARDRKASTSYIQRSLKIGYNRAANIIEEMERDGVVGPANHVGKREILVREEEYA